PTARMQLIERACARDRERACLTEVTIVDLAVVANVTNDPCCEAYGQAELGSQRTFRTEEASYRDVVRRQHLIDVGGRDLESFGFHECVDDPGKRAVPGRVVLERETGQRLLGERLGKYDEGVGVGNARADAHELRFVGGDRVTAA